MEAHENLKKLEDAFLQDFSTNTLAQASASIKHCEAHLRSLTREVAGLRKDNLELRNLVHNLIAMQGGVANDSQG